MCWSGVGWDSRQYRYVDNFDACRLTSELRQQLLNAQDECTIAWTNDDGWPIALVQTYVWANGAFWVTAFSSKPRVNDLRNRPKAAVSVSSKGTELGAEKMASARVTAVVHDDDETKAWFYPAFAQRAAPSEAARVGFAKFLSRQDRVIIELRPVRWTTFDGAVLRATPPPPRG